MRHFKRLAAVYGVLFWMVGSLTSLRGDDVQAIPVTFTKEGGAVHIAIGGAAFADYVYADPRISRPYFAHVKTADGLPVTRNHPPIEGRDRVDHAEYHPGVWLAFGDINGHDYWRLKARVKHAGFLKEPQGESNHGSFVVQNQYLSADGDQIICVEVCRIDVHVLPAGWLLLYESEFKSDSNAFVFGDQEEFGLGIRVTTPIAVEKGGRILDSEGRQNEKGVWGKQAVWCDYGGVVQDRFIGMAIMPSPHNFRSSWFHARDYGLLVANPFGRKAMTGGEASAQRVPKGEAFRLGYGLLVHSAPKDAPVDLKEAYRAYLKILSDRKQ